MELIKMEMTPKERATAYAKGEEVDRIPTNLSQGETIPILYGIKMTDYYFSSDLMFEVECRMAEEFQSDNMGMGLGLRTLAEALGTKIKYVEDNVAHVEEPAINDYDELDDRRLVDIEKDGRIPLMLETYKRLQEKYGKVRNIGTGSAGPFTLASSLIGTEKFLKDMVKNPEGVHKLMRYATENFMKCAEDFYYKMGMGVGLSEPMICKNLLSPRNFQRFAVPYLTETVERMTKLYGKAPSLHACGVTHDRWEQIVGTGISSFWADNCESLADLKNQYGTKIAIAGNVAPVDILCKGTPEEIEQDVIRCLAEAADSPCGFTLCPGCTTPVGTSKENMIAMMNAAATFGRRAKKGQMPEGMKGYEGTTFI